MLTLVAFRYKLIDFIEQLPVHNRVSDVTEIMQISLFIFRFVKIHLFINNLTMNRPKRLCLIIINK